MKKMNSNEFRHYNLNVIIIINVINVIINVINNVVVIINVIIIIIITQVLRIYQVQVHYHVYKTIKTCRNTIISNTIKAY